eukprot:462881-Pyramimonas_sp.AAC.2
MVLQSLRHECTSKGHGFPESPAPSQRPPMTHRALEGLCDGSPDGRVILYKRAILDMFVL